MFALTVPVMIDADGAVRRDIRPIYDTSEKVVTYVAEWEWLENEAWVYLVWNTLVGAVLVEYSSFQMNMVAKGGTYLGTPDVNIQYFDLNINTMAGFSEDYGYCRTLLIISPDWLKWNLSSIL